MSDIKDYGFVVVHIPHASVIIPEFYRKTILLDNKQLAKELRLMTDIFCDELYNAPKFCNRLVAPVSRLVCDMERFRDDNFEPCAKKGQGLMYTRTYGGKRLRKNDAALKSRILNELYDPHHEVLTAMVDEALHKYGKCLIIDGHSFFQKSKKRNPDFDIGTDSFHTPNGLCYAVCEKVKELGFSVKVNTPYAGAITPIKHYQKDKRVFSIMFEVNRKLYINSAKKNVESFTKSKNFDKIQEACRALMKYTADFVYTQYF